MQQLEKDGDLPSATIESDVLASHGVPDKDDLHRSMDVDWKFTSPKNPAKRFGRIEDFGGCQLDISLPSMLKPAPTLIIGRNNLYLNSVSLGHSLLVGKPLRLKQNCENAHPCTALDG